MHSYIYFSHTTIFFFDFFIVILKSSFKDCVCAEHEWFQWPALSFTSITMRVRRGGFCTGEISRVGYDDDCNSL